MKGNKGEWSEVYTLLKLLSDGRIYAADEFVNKIKDIYFPILKVFRNKGWENNDVEYNIDDKKQIIEIYLNDECVEKINASRLNKEAKKLYESICKSNNRSFQILETENFMYSIYMDKIKASSHDKKDIVMQVHDINTGYEPICGFSIKSEIGAAPTLLNASGATNFIYEIENINDNTIETINSIESKQKIKDRMKVLVESSYKVIFKKLFNDIFYGNLMLIDTSFPQIMAEALKISFLEDISDCKSVVEKLEERNPLRYPRKGLYEYKFKKFLCAVALGLMPARFWDGIDDANGGYIIVRKDGEVLAYYIYNRSAFENYLLNNTKFEKGSTTKHNYASLYKEGTKVLLNLNLSIRFM